MNCISQSRKETCCIVLHHTWTVFKFGVGLWCHLLVVVVKWSRICNVSRGGSRVFWVRSSWYVPRSLETVEFWFKLFIASCDKVHFHWALITSAGKLLECALRMHLIWTVFWDLLALNLLHTFDEQRETNSERNACMHVITTYFWR